MFNVLLVQRVAPSYRLPLFYLLNGNKQINYSFALGEINADNTLKSPENYSNDFKYIKLKNIYWNKSEKICWQLGIVRHFLFRRYDAAIAEFNPRIVTNIILFIISKMRKQHFIWWGQGVSRNNETFFNWIIRKFIMLHSTLILLYDQETYFKLINRGIPKEKLLVVLNSIDTLPIKRLKIKYDPNIRFRVLFVGRLMLRKKVDLLINAFNKWERKDYVLTIIGDGPELARLKGLAKSKYIEFIGSLFSEETLAKYYNEAILCVSPGHIGLFAIQSIAYGVPLLVADHEPHAPEISALKNSEAVEFFQSDNDESLKGKIADLATDYNRLANMSAEALSICEQKYSIESMATMINIAILKISNSF